MTSARLTEKFARVTRDLGWRVTAVDVRTERMPRDSGIEWVQSDVRERPARWQRLHLILGLFYHLSSGDQLDLLRRAAGTLTIIDTHVARAPPSVSPSRCARRLGRTANEGVHFKETLDEPTASWGSHESFWPTEESS